MDAQTQQILQQMQTQIGQLQSALGRQQRDSAFAPSSNDPYVVPGPRDFYSYTVLVPTASFAAAATYQATISVEADSYFYANALSYCADIAAAALTESTNVIPLATLTILDTGSGRQLMAQPVALGAIAGDGKRPYRLPKPRRFAPTSQIILTFVNYSAATAYNIRFTIHGFKVYAQQNVAMTGPVGGQ
jgi:hypothetical protein